MVQIVIPPTRVDLIRIWLRQWLSSDKKMMDQILRKNEKTRWKRNLNLCNISESFTHRHHVINRQILFLPRQESFPIPSNCIDVVRHSQTNLDTFQKHNIDDDRNVYGARPFSGSFIGFTRFTILKNPPAPWTHVCRRKTLKYANYSQA